MADKKIKYQKVDHINGQIEVKNVTFRSFDLIINSGYGWLGEQPKRTRIVIPLYDVFQFARAFVEAADNYQAQADYIRAQVAGEL